MLFDAWIVAKEHKLTSESLLEGHHGWGTLEGSSFEETLYIYRVQIREGHKKYFKILRNDFLGLISCFSEN